MSDQTDGADRTGPGAGVADAAGRGAAGGAAEASAAGPSAGPGVAGGASAAAGSGAGPGAAATGGAGAEAGAGSDAGAPAAAAGTATAGVGGAVPPQPTPGDAAAWHAWQEHLFQQRAAAARAKAAAPADWTVRVRPAEAAPVGTATLAAALVAGLASALLLGDGLGLGRLPRAPRDTRPARLRVAVHARDPRRRTARRAGPARQPYLARHPAQPDRLPRGRRVRRRLGLDRAALP